MDQLIQIKRFIEGQLSAFKIMHGVLKSDYNNGLIDGLKLALAQIDREIAAYDKGQAKEFANG